MKSSLLVSFLVATSVIAQTGGGYDLRHAVIAGGGATNSTGGAYVLGGTIGQAIAGTTSTSTQYSLRGGFWIEASLAPTAAGVSVSGRVRTADLRPIRGVLLVLTAPDGTFRKTSTNAFGNFRFEDVAAGNTYVIQISSRRHLFEQPSQVLSVEDTVSDLEFIARP